MKELCLKKINQEDFEIHYSGYYRLKPFEMIVNTYDGYNFSLIKGELTKDEWNDVVAKYYHDDYQCNNQFTGKDNGVKRDSELRDMNSKRVHEGDAIRFCGHKGKVVFECGCLGVAVEDGIDYDALQKFMDSHEVECCGNEFTGCFNDNFISLWEIYWNFGCMENYLWMVEII